MKIEVKHHRLLANTTRIQAHFICAITKLLIWDTPPRTGAACGGDVDVCWCALVRIAIIDQITINFIIDDNI